MQTNIDHLCGKTIEYGDYLVYSFYLTPKLLDNAGDKFYKEIRQNPNYGKANFEKRYDCTFWTLDIIFADGSRLSEATDQYGIKLEVNQQYNSKTLFINQINYKCINLAEFSGKTIDKVIMTYPIDLDIRIADIIEVNHFMGDIVDLIDTRRGSNNTANCSRGNVFPVVSEPFGFLFGMPFTNSPGSNQPYIYSSNKIYGFGISHIYDYKIGDKEVISCFARQKGEKCEFSEFSHLNELARPYAYSVVLNNKVKVRMTVHKYTCLVEYDFTEAGGKSVEIIVTENLEKSFSYTEILGGTIRNIEKDGNKTIYTVEFKKKRKVVVNLTQSFISEAQAKFNYKKLSFSRCFLVLNRVWKKLLSKYTVGGTKFSLTQIFYSNIFRIHLYPNMLYEKTPDGKIIHPDIYNINDGKPAEGALMINNDFSKTYRLVWPAIFLFHSDRAGELLQNLWQNYSDSSKASQTLISSVGDDAENIYFNIILQLSVIYNIKNLAIENIPGPSAAHLEDSYNLDKQINEHLKKNNEHLKTDPFGLKGYPICEKKHILNLFGGEDNLAKALDNYFLLTEKLAKKML
ncbi:MAG: glycoside hydrolase family 92 protein [Bifidobacteriaceae bacterium]|jgi:hypothetical protein|nr:glycoside hydrolase family 92 protein [Bifidobacteriaceae bacterium]